MSDGFDLRARTFHYRRRSALGGSEDLMMRWLLAFGLLIVASGCGTFDPANNATQPWDRPTKADASQGWWIRDWNQQESLIEYP